VNVVKQKYTRLHAQSLSSILPATLRLPATMHALYTYEQLYTDRNFQLTYVNDVNHLAKPAKCAKTASSRPVNARISYKKQQISEKWNYSEVSIIVIIAE